MSGSRVCLSELDLYPECSPPSNLKCASNNHRYFFWHLSSPRQGGDRNRRTCCLHHPQSRRLRALCGFTHRQTPPRRIRHRKSHSTELLFENVHRHFDRVDVVVNNAGYDLNSVVEGASNEDARYQLDVNFWGAVRISREVRICRDFALIWLISLLFLHHHISRP